MVDFYLNISSLSPLKMVDLQSFGLIVKEVTRNRKSLPFMKKTQIS